MVSMTNIFFSDKLSSEHATEMEDIKSLVHRLFVALHLEDHQIRKERELLQKLDHLKGELLPLEQVGKWGYLFFKLKSISFHQASPVAEENQHECLGCVWSVCYVNCINSSRMQIIFNSILFLPVVDISGVETTTPGEGCYEHG